MEIHWPTHRCSVQASPQEKVFRNNGPAELVREDVRFRLALTSLRFMSSECESFIFFFAAEVLRQTFAA